MDLESVNQTMNLVFQILMFVLPIATVAITWFLRTFVKSAEAEKAVGAIVRVSNAAIDFAEDLDSRGDLEKYLKMWDMPDDVVNLTSNGLKKLNLAGRWLEGELGKLGINMTDEEAQAWIASEFQKRVGDIGRERGLAERTREASDLLRTLHQSELITLPTDGPQAILLANQIADWVVAQLDGDETEPLLEQVLVRLHTQLETPVAQPVQPSLETQLAALATQSVKYVEELKASHELTLPEVDIAVAWVLTEATKQGLPATTDQIASAIRAAFGQ